MLYNGTMKFKTEMIIGKKLPNIDIELNESDCAIAFGLSLRRLRKNKGLTLDKLSEEIQITNPTLNRYESGYNLPSIFMALKIAQYFDINIEQIIFAGICEMEDINKGLNTSESKYVENFVGVSQKLNEVFGNKTKIILQDHKRKKR